MHIYSTSEIRQARGTDMFKKPTRARVSKYSTNQPTNQNCLQTVTPVETWLDPTTDSLTPARLKMSRGGMCSNYILTNITYFL